MVLALAASSIVICHGLAGHLLGSFLVLFTHTTQSGPCPEVSASARGEGVQTEGAHRTLKDIEALYRFGLPGGRLNAKRRRASPHIASSWQPAEPPFRAEPPEATTRPFNGHLIPAGIEHKIDGGGGTVATGTHTTPDSPGHISRVQCGLNGMFNSHFLRSADRPS